MAIREVRLNFAHDNIEFARDLNRCIGQPFTWFMDGVMRGRFKLYSGPEVKGVNIVNCNLQFNVFDEPAKWETLLNTYEIDCPLDLEIFEGDRVNKVTQGIIYFCELSKLSPLPQLKMVREHALESLSEQKVLESIDKADEYYSYIFNQSAMVNLTSQ